MRPVLRPSRPWLWLWLCALPVAALALPIEVDIRYHDGSRDEQGRLIAEFRSDYAPGDANDTYQQQRVAKLRELLEQALQDHELSDLLTHANEMLGEFHANVDDDRFKLNEDGKLVIAIETQLSNGPAYFWTRPEEARGGALARSDRHDAPLRSFVSVPSAYITKYMASGWDQARQVKELKQSLLHEITHWRHAAAMSLVYANYVRDARLQKLGPQALKTLDRMRTLKGGSHEFEKISDPKLAFSEGLAEAQVIFEFKEEARRYGVYYEGFFDVKFWGSDFLEHLPDLPRNLLALAHTTTLVPGHPGAIIWEDVARNYDGNVNDLLAPDAAHITDVPTFGGLTQCEGFVAGILYQLWKAEVVSVWETLALLQKYPCASMNDFVANLKIFLSTVEGGKAKLPMVDDVLNKCTLGLYSRREEVAGIWREYLDTAKSVKGMARQSKKLEFLTKLHKVLSRPADPNVQKTSAADAIKSGMLKEDEGGETRGEALAKSEEPTPHASQLKNMVAIALSVAVSHYAESLITGQGSANPRRSIEESEKILTSPEFLENLALQEATTRGTTGLSGLAGRAVAKRMNGVVMGLARDALKKCEVVSLIGMLAAEYLTRNFAHHAYIWKCDKLNAAQKAWAMTRCCITDLSLFTRDDRYSAVCATALAAGAPAFVSVGIGVVAFASGGTVALGGLAVYTLVAVTGSALAYFGNVVGAELARRADERDLANYKAVLDWALAAAESSAVNADPPGNVTALLQEGEAQAFRTAVNVDAKRDLLCRALGQMGEKAVPNRCGCDPGEKPVRQPVRCLLAAYLDFRDALRAKALGRVQGAIDARKEEMGKQQEQLDQVINIFHRPNVDLRTLAIIHLVNPNNDLYTPQEIADHLTRIARRDPVANKAFGHLPDFPATDAEVEAFEKALPAQLETLDRRILGEITPILTSFSRAESLAACDDLRSFQRQRAKEAVQRYSAFVHEWTEGLQRDTVAAIEELRQIAQSEVADLDAMLPRLDAIGLKTKQPEVYESLVERKEQLAQLAPAYVRLVQGLREAQTQAR